MHKKLRVISLTIAVLLAIFLVYFFINYTFLHKSINENVNQYVLKYGFYAVFLFIFLLEVSPQPFVSGLLPLASGFALGLNGIGLMIIAISSVIIASFTAYAVGVYYGPKVSKKIVGEEQYQRYIRTAKKHGPLALAIMAFSPIPYFPVLAGAFKIEVREFFVFGIFFRILHYLTFGYLIHAVI